jgi:hypothetical protein
MKAMLIVNENLFAVFSYLIPNLIFTFDRCWNKDRRFRLKFLYETKTDKPFFVFS